jgi:hypothetical protein
MLPELQKPAFPVSHESDQIIDKVFNCAIHTVRRTKELVWELKELAVALIILWALLNMRTYCFRLFAKI